MTHSEQIVAIISNKALTDAQKADAIGALTAKPAAKLHWKLSEKGCVSVYGLNAKFPVSLYPSQWKRLLAVSAEFSKFVNEQPDVRK